MKFKIISVLILLTFLVSTAVFAKPKMRDKSHWEHIWTDPATGNQYAVDANNIFFETWSEEIFCPLRIYDASKKRWDIYLVTYFGSSYVQAFHYIRYWGNTKEMTWKSAIRETWNEIHTNCGRDKPMTDASGRPSPQMTKWQLMLVDWVTDFIHTQTEWVQFLETGEYAPKLVHYPY